MTDYHTPKISFKTSSNVEKAYTIVAFQGDLDKFGLEKIREEVDIVVEKIQVPVMVFDFSDLRFVNSEGIGFILTVHYRLLKKHKRLVIVGANEHVNDVLQVIGLTKIIDNFPSLTDFEKTLI